MYSELDLHILKAITTNRKHALEFVSENDAKLFAPEVWNFANVVINYIKNYKDILSKIVLLFIFNDILLSSTKFIIFYIFLSYALSKIALHSIGFVQKFLSGAACG